MKRAFGLLAFLAVSAAIRSPGQNVIAWGTNTQGQCNVPPLATNVIAVAAGGTFSLALRSDGSLITWGVVATPPADLKNAVQIAAGSVHCIALRTDGTVTAWGNNSQNQLTVPPSATNIIAITA